MTDTPISYVTPTGTLTWTAATEPGEITDPDLIAGGYLFGPSPLTRACRDILDNPPTDGAEVRYGHYYDFTPTADTLPDVLAAMLLTGPGHLDIEGWDALAGHLDGPSSSGEEPLVIR